MAMTEACFKQNRHGIRDFLLMGSPTTAHRSAIVVNRRSSNRSESMLMKLVFCAGLILIGASAVKADSSALKQEKKAEASKAPTSTKEKDKQPAASQGPKSTPSAKPSEQPQGKAEAAPASDKVKFEFIGVEKAVIERTNEHRARYGLPPLEVDESLMGSARQHATWMTLNRRLAHTSAPVAENIAMGQNDSHEVLQSWMNSPGHRANILNGAFSRIGVAAYRTVSGTVYWCQQFRR
jgi:uncharacterized protein YkwD